MSALGPNQGGGRTWENGGISTERAKKKKGAWDTKSCFRPRTRSLLQRFPPPFKLCHAWLPQGLNQLLLQALAEL